MAEVTTSAKLQEQGKILNFFIFMSLRERNGLGQLIPNPLMHGTSLQTTCFICDFIQIKTVKAYAVLMAMFIL